MSDFATASDEIRRQIVAGLGVPPAVFADPACSSSQLAAAVWQREFEADMRAKTVGLVFWLEVQFGDLAEEGRRALEEYRRERAAKMVENPEKN